MVSLPSSVSSASPRTLITASVVLSSTLTALSIVSFQALRRKSLRESLRRDVALSLTKDDLRIQHDGYPEPDGRDAQLLADGGIMQVDGREVGSDAAGQAGGKKKKFSEELVREQVRLFFSLLGVLESSPCAVEPREGRSFHQGSWADRCLSLRARRMVYCGQLARNYVFLGEEGMALVRKSYVVVVGCGGVGSWAALMLLRSYVRLSGQLPLFCPPRPTDDRSHPVRFRRGVSHLLLIDVSFFLSDSLSTLALWADLQPSACRPVRPHDPLVLEPTWSVRTPRLSTLSGRLD
jgi:hypothetical protein